MTARTALLLTLVEANAPRLARAARTRTRIPVIHVPPAAPAAFEAGELAWFRRPVVGG